MFTSNYYGQAARSIAATPSYLPSASTLALVIVIGLLVYFTSSTFFYGRYTVPLPSYKSGFKDSEGFTVPERSFLPPPPACSSDSVTSSLLTPFQSGHSTTEEGQRDYLEFKQMIHKLSCFKKDLVSPKYTIDSTLKQPFITTHDIEPISETTGRCFAKTLPPRDLDIAMDKWTDRGGFLIPRLCTSFSLSESQLTAIEAAFQTFIRDIYDTAREKCLQKEPLDVSKRGPRDPSPFSVRTDPQVGDYTGYY